MNVYVLHHLNLTIYSLQIKNNDIEMLNNLSKVKELKGEGGRSPSLAV